MLNSSINAFLNDKRWQEYTEGIIELVLKDKDLILIWRPHPLLGQTIKAIKKEFAKEYEMLCHKVENAENGILDTSGDFAEAASTSDAMISDYSSLVMQYTFLGKPILLLQTTSEYRKSTEVYCDYFSNYFVEDGVEVSDFIHMIKNGIDDKKEERMRFAENSVANADGTCGEKTHKAVMKKICFWERDEGENGFLK